ncbi:type 1 periplasmic-binding domain-containing protein [Vibrio coralliilyticus]|uniref:hypothetical protein n=1 Tax=Vibrio coralliilyticus TaxID=190893 RepID=UPI001E3C026B|nr:hypothetical protein [Vibrio coralliilyticus]MCC2521061.1 hypothetical protein [Vibrio coralliilyticus]
MKKITILSALTLTMSLGVSANQTKDESWHRDTKDFQTYWTNSYDSNYKALMRKIDANEKHSAFIDFRLLIDHKDCQKIDSDYRGETLLEVNHQEIKFIYSCYENKVLNLEPKNDEGKTYILEEFQQRSGKSVTFRWPKSNQKDWIFNFSKTGFKDYYKAVKKSVKKPI